MKTKLLFALALTWSLGASAATNQLLTRTYSTIGRTSIGGSAPISVIDYKKLPGFLTEDHLVGDKTQVIVDPRKKRIRIIQKRRGQRPLDLRIAVGKGVQFGTGFRFHMDAADTGQYVNIEGRVDEAYAGQSVIYRWESCTTFSGGSGTEKVAYRYNVFRREQFLDFINPSDLVVLGNYYALVQSRLNLIESYPVSGCY
jgi:hypothetical protein